MRGAARGRRGNVPSTAGVLAEWKFFLPANVKTQNALAYFKLVYRYVARMSGVANVPSDCVRNDTLSVFFIPKGHGRRSGDGHVRDSISRGEYLAFYEELRGHLAEEMGFAPDLDADDGIFVNLGYGQDERTKAIESRECICAPHRSSEQEFYKSLYES